MFQLNQSIPAQCFISLLPETDRKAKVFWCFQGVQKQNIGLKWVKFVMLNWTILLDTGRKLNLPKISNLRSVFSGMYV